MLKAFALGVAIAALPLIGHAQEQPREWWRHMSSFKNGLSLLDICVLAADTNVASPAVLYNATASFGWSPKIKEFKDHIEVWFYPENLDHLRFEAFFRTKADCEVYAKPLREMWDDEQKSIDKYR